MKSAKRKGLEEGTAVKAWFDGEFVDWHRTDVPLLSHSFSR